MRAVLQRVSSASVVVNLEVVGAIGQGLLVLIGVEQADTETDARWLADKLVTSRIFEDENGKLNRSVSDVQGSLLLVSQFTLLGDLRQGRRPSFTAAMEPVAAEALFNSVCELCREAKLPVETGRFRTDMQVTLCNDGPVTLLIDSRKRI